MKKLLIVLTIIAIGCSPKEGTEKYYYKEGMKAFNNTNYYKAKESFETLLRKYPASTYQSEVATKLETAKQKIASIEEDAHRIQRGEWTLSVLDLISNKTKYASEKVTVAGYIFSNFSFAEEFELTDEPHNYNPKVSVKYGNLPTEEKKILLPLTPGRTTWRVTVTGIFDGSDNIIATKCIVH